MPKFTASLNVPQYSSTPSSAHNGDVYYNTTTHTFYARINGSWVDLAANTGGGGGTGIAESVRAAVRNVTGSTITKGSIVYLNGVNGEKPTIAKAIATGDPTSAETIGWVEDDITNNSDGYVTTFGILNNVNTQGLSDGAYLYLSGTTAGSYTATKPYAPTHNVTVGFVVKGGSVGAGQIFVLIKNGFELEELHDVQVNGAAAGTYLKYNGTLWVADDQVVTLTGTQTVTNKTLTDPKVGGILTVDNNTASPMPVPALEGIMVHLVNGDTSSSRVVIDSHGSDVKSGVTVRRSRGTAASPTAIQSGDVLGELGARGYGSSQFPEQSTGRVVFAAAENFTDTANGTKVVINATANGSVNATEELTITAGSGGGVNLPTNRSYKINNTDVLTSSALGSGVLSSSLTSVGTITTGVWNASAVPVANGGTGATSEVGARTNILPSQTGNSGKFLKTDGSDVQWATALTSVSNEVIDGGGA